MYASPSRVVEKGKNEFVTAADNFELKSNIPLFTLIVKTKS